ncbi:protein SPMIP2 [Sorex fumeus]|uniref:protein SPMIP2 n=1 Tax=Sorex fumeus TaxID=62283 RepID=UPI0024AE84A2|nr:protein SPMIP2 [Sorex fumeus]
MVANNRRSIPDVCGVKLIHGLLTNGPDYVTDHLPRVCRYTSYIGEKHTTVEKTGDLNYLWRPSPDINLPAKYKHEHVGEIGWGIPMHDFINRTRLQTGFHIKYKEPSQGVIEKIGHRYQNPWQPKPAIMDKRGKFSRGSLAWHMGEFENDNERDSKYAVLIKQDRETLPRLSRPPKLPKKNKKERKRKKLQTLNK